MDADTCQRIIDLNRQFYQTFAQPFSITRQRLQPGVRRALEHIPIESSVLDLGCGNGELWRALAMRGQRGPYIGLDFSAGLLEAAEERARKSRSDNDQPAFIQADLTRPDWAEAVPYKRVEIVTAFAVMHHLPGIETRLAFLQQIKRLMMPQGRLFLSNWQFLNSERLRRRIQPWEVTGLAQEQVDAGDYLLDWRQGGLGLRYVHHFSEEELDELAREAGFGCLETYFSDGEGERLSIYQIWKSLE